MYPARAAYYTHLFVALGVAAGAYSLPRLPMYLISLWRRKSYGRLKLYFRTRIFTFIALLIDIGWLGYMVYGNLMKLAIEYDSTEGYILF
jgi:hypothetical protein